MVTFFVALYSALMLRNAYGMSANEATRIVKNELQNQKPLLVIVDDRYFERGQVCVGPAHQNMALITGDFNADGREDICALLRDDKFIIKYRDESDPDGLVLTKALSSTKYEKGKVASCYMKMHLVVFFKTEGGWLQKEVFNKKEYTGSISNKASLLGITLRIAKDGSDSLRNAEPGWSGKVDFDRSRRTTKRDVIGLEECGKWYVLYFWDDLDCKFYEVCLYD